ncbi:glycine rich domain-containing protein [Cohnella lupini]|uniref:receptor protein-tyrosine kinase n=1 Tax=Cohnella lupini TaxID=1294267 RepID=A0A3D9IMK3_9BACL|nr:glycine rich domain-containing protein [Cohnella lupini]RED63010.1 glycine rich protein [Cohnella lupini]
MKKLLNYLLLVVITMTSIVSPWSVRVVNAATGAPAPDAEKLGIHFVSQEEADKSPYGVEAGDIIFIAVNQKATTNIKYQTAGWIIRKEGVPGEDNDHIICSDRDIVTEYSKLHAECTPEKGSNHFSIEKSQFGIPVYEDVITGTSPVQLKTVYVLKKEIFKQEMDKHEEFIGIQDKTTLYFNATFNVTVDGVISGSVYKTLDSIRKARGWANKSGFRQYYDQPVTFYGGEDKLIVETRLESNQELELKDNWEDPTPYKVSAPTAAINLESTFISPKDKKTYKLVCSYMLPESLKDERGDCSEKGTSPYFQRDFKTTSRNPTMAYGGLRIVALYKELDKCLCSQEIVIPGQSTLGGKIENAKLGKKIPIQIKMEESNTSIADWTAYLASQKDIKVYVRLWRTDVVPDGTGNTGATPIWEKVGTSPDWDTEVAVSAVDALAYLKGTKTLSYNDNLMNYPIEPGKKVIFKYNTSVSIVSTNLVTGDKQSVSCAGGVVVSPKIEFQRPEAPVTDHGYYTSTPQYWSEIKEGSPSLTGTGSDETFEAMAGTPTTRNLYFSSGGSEFIVDIETEYVPNATATRTYTSTFTPVKSGQFIAPSEGPIVKDTQPTCNTARFAEDVSGARFTESVTIKTGTYTKVPAEPAQGTPGQPGYVPAKAAIPGPTYQCMYSGGHDVMVGGYTDTWTQTSTFDYMKIVKAQVWKLDRSKVNGMVRLIGTDQVTATVTQGDPTLFKNVAASNTSAAGRLRYSSYSDQHDNVVWNEGPSDNRDSNSDSDSYVNEKKVFKERRDERVLVTAVSDFLILQTSTGDQSVMYFEKESPEVKQTDPLVVPKTSFDKMWTSNPNSAAKWNEYNVKVGSYNGNYSNPSSKYSGGAGYALSTVFDRIPAGINKPPRPSAPMRLMNTALNVTDTIPNGLYVTGQSSVFYKVEWNHNPAGKPAKYSIGVDGEYNQAGQSYVSAYSPMHGKVNDIVIHNPVSTEFAMVETLPEELDQRTDASVNLGGNLSTPVIEYERVLKPGYVFVPTPPTFQELDIPNPDYVAAKPSTTETFSYTGSPDTYTVPSAGTYTIEAWGAQGGVASTVTSNNGGYSAGKLNLNAGDKLTIRVGGKGTNGSSTIDTCDGCSKAGGYNGGGSGVGSAGSGGGGASDVALDGGTSYTDKVTMPINQVYATGIDNSFFTSPSNHAANSSDVVEIRVKNNSANTSGAIYFMGTYASTWSESYVVGFNMTPSDADYKIYTVNIGTHGAWAGNITDLRLDLANGLNSGNIQVDYVKIKTATASGSKLVVAGGGGGDTSGNGTAYGGSAKLTDSLGTGESGDTSRHSPTYPNDEAGGGGGYYGGQVRHGDDARWSFGGTNYVSPGLTAQSNLPGNSSMPSPSGGTQTGQSGDGFVRITTPGTPAIGTPTIKANVMTDPGQSVPPDSAYILIPISTDPDADVTVGGKSYTPGKFILLDYGFTIFFPNSGNFYGNGAHGISNVTSDRGKGFVDNMDTTEWTKEKAVKFAFNVIYDGTMYTADEWIDLPVAQSSFDFYVPLGNNERTSALVEYKSIAINGEEDNEATTNKVRYDNYQAKHSASKKYNVDVVGRIGNMTIQDTEDFRYSNLFKMPLDPTQWLIKNIVKKVDLTKQNEIVGDTLDIRGEPLTKARGYLDTYGMLAHLSLKEPISFPLSPEKNNNIPSLVTQPIRLGYSTLSDIQTIGNYYDSLQIIPYYYALDLQTGDLKAVDIYMDVNGQYKPINKNGIAAPGWDPTTIYQHVVGLDWLAESKRRNVSPREEEVTSAVAEYQYSLGMDDTVGGAGTPYGNNYNYGTAQILYPTGRNRTYIGSAMTNGWDKNPGLKLPEILYQKQAQRWHYSFALPSSSVVVEKGKEPTKANIDELRKSTTKVLLMTADIKAIGETFVLQYESTNNNGFIRLKGFPVRSLANVPHPVINVYSISKSSADDLDVFGTH